MAIQAATPPGGDSNPQSRIKGRGPHGALRPQPELHCRSYSPLLTFLSTVNPAFFASEMDNGLSLCGELKVEMILRTGFLHAGQCVSGLAESGRRKVKLPPQTLQSPSHNSYS